MLADTFVEAGQFGGAVGGQVDEAQLYLLIIFVERIDLPAAGLALQADVFAVAVGVELELTAAEGDFLITFGIVASAAAARVKLPASTTAINMVTR